MSITVVIDASALLISGNREKLFLEIEGASEDPPLVLTGVEIAEILVAAAGQAVGYLKENEEKTEREKSFLNAYGELMSLHANLSSELRARWSGAWFAQDH